MSTSREEKQLRNARIIEEIAQGDKTYEEIAQSYGLTRGRIDQLLTTEPGGEEARSRHKELKRQSKMDILNKAIDEKLSYRQIADKYGRDQSYWRVWAEKLGVADQIHTASKQNAVRRQEILDYLAEGHTQREAAEKFDTTQVNISAIAVRNGVRRRYTGNELVERNEQIAADLKSGMTYAETAEKYGLSYASIYNAARFGGAVSSRDPEVIKARNEAIAQKLKDGMSPTEIAESDNVSIYVVYNIAKELGMHTAKSRTTGKDKSKRDKAILKKYEAGYSAKELAEMYDLSVHTIYGLASAAGIKHNDTEKNGGKAAPATAKKKRNDKIVADYRNGTTYEKIAQRYDVSVSTVYQVLKKAGVLGDRKF